MTASSSIVRDSIRRIALSDPDIRALLDDFKNRGGSASDSIEIEGAADDRQICCDGSTASGGANPGSSTRDPSDNPQDGIDPDDPAKITGNLTGVTDCETGEPVCFEGSGWVPPDGWDSPTDPPEIAQWVPGAQWRAKRGTFASNGGSAIDSINNLGTFILDYRYDGDGGYTFSVTLTEVDRVDFTMTIEIPDGRTETRDGFTERKSCEEEYAAPYCDDGYEHQAQWPADGCINLANKGGKFVASKYDPEASSDYLKGVSEIELCDDYGNSFKLRASGSSPGGWKSISSQNSDDGYLYNSSGEQIARISGSEYSDPAV